jgi:hypothetical protein
MLDMAETDDDKTVSWIRLSDENGTPISMFMAGCCCWVNAYLHSTLKLGLVEPLD